MNIIWKSILVGQMVRLFWAKYRTVRFQKSLLKHPEKCNLLSGLIITDGAIT